MVDAGTRVRRDYFEAVRQMEPLDAAVLDVIARRLNPHSDEVPAAEADNRFIEQERSRLDISPDDLAIALSKLVKLDCAFMRQVIRSPPGSTVQGPPQPSEYPPSLTPFGRGLMAACKRP